ncbi:hypothetical protein GG804_21365 [Sphingomonas histidinilytica]|uniref:hypothetical protein n=1 Tax=Rhizorhabdus histidinilytica TaxID=439228 RepID=UPI001ADB95B6|nr:hypothetical protein [Rhizorhabdus histidinilytica]MBO9379325.1 hypothetical protein [Rhizorhabdus histidinilytica]
MLRKALAALALSAALPPAGALGSCPLDYGEKLLRWVDDDAGRQSRLLAEADFKARTFNAFLIGFEELNRRTVEVAARLDALTAAIRASEGTIGAADAVGGADQETVRAILRDQNAASIEDALAQLRAELAVLQRLHRELMADPTLDRFQLAGLGNVGRASLVASLQEMGDLTQLDLAQRYGFYVGVTIADDGRITGAGDPPPNVTMVDNVAFALSYYTGPYAPFVMAAYLMGRHAWNEQECRRERKRQDRLVSRASRRLGKVLIKPDAQFALYEKLFLENRALFEASSSPALRDAQDKLLERWKNLVAFNAERSAAAHAVLSAAVIENVRRQAGSGGPLDRLFETLGRARLSSDIGRTASYAARKELTAMRACRDAGGLRALEALDEANGYAESVYEAFGNQRSLATLQPLLDSRMEASKAARTRAAQLRAALPAGGCGSGPDPAPDEIAAQPGTEAAFFEKRGIAMKALAADGIAGSGEFGFCILWRNGNGRYGCGQTGGSSYASQFATASAQGQSILGRAIDGGYRADARISAGIDGVRANIEKRIGEVTARFEPARAAMGAWSDQNRLALQTLSSVAATRLDGERADRVRFSTAQAQVNAEARVQIDRFLAAPSADASAATLAGAIGAPQLGLPRLAEADIPADAPPVAGISAPTRAYAPDLALPARTILQERRKVMRDMSPGSPARRIADDALDGAARLAANGAPDELIDALVTDAAAMRFFERGDLPVRTVAIIDEAGKLRRIPLLDPAALPRESLLARLRDYRSDEILLDAGIAGLESEGSGLTPQGLRVLDAADQLRLKAAQKLHSGDPVAAQVAQELAKPLVDLAVSLSPLGWPRDVYESFSGSDLLSGEPLDTFGYTAAVFGAITFGGGKPVMKAIDFVRGLTVIGHHVDDVARIVDAAHAIDQGVLANTSAHAIVRLDATRPGARIFTDDVLEDALNTGTRFWDAEHDSIVAFEQVSGEGARRAGVAVAWREMRVTTVVEEFRSDSQLLNATIGVGNPRADFQRYYPLEDIDLTPFLY